MDYMNLPPTPPTPPREYRIFKGPVIEPLMPARHYRVLHRYYDGYDYGPGVFPPYDPLYLDERRKIGAIATASTFLALGGSFYNHPEATLLGLTGMSVSGVAAIVNNIKRRARVNQQIDYEYQRDLAARGIVF
jgi:hypothetical protein